MDPWQNEHLLKSREIMAISHSGLILSTVAQQGRLLSQEIELALLHSCHTVDGLF